MSNSKVFFEACANGDVAVLRGLLANDPSLARASNPEGRYPGWTGLHTAAQRGHVDVVRLLVERGADPNAREGGDNTYALHWAAANRNLEIVRALLDAGGDAHGVGDVHELDAIGWATFYHAPDGAPGDKPEVASLLVERGARHHIFSAIAVGDLALIRTLVEQNPKALDRRMSRFEGGQTALHFAVSQKRYDILDLLIELGAELEAKDLRGQTALAVAMLHGDWAAMKGLHAAGSKLPPGWEIEGQRTEAIDGASIGTSMANLADSTKRIVPMIRVPDVAATLAWYPSIGFKELGRFEAEGVVNWGMVSFGHAHLMLIPGGKPGPHEVSLWFYTDKVDELYQLLKSRQLEAARAALAGEPGGLEGVAFEEDLYDPPYGGRQFSIRDLNGYMLVFYTG